MDLPSYVLLKSGTLTTFLCWAFLGAVDCLLASGTHKLPASISLPSFWPKRWQSFQTRFTRWLLCSCPFMSVVLSQSHLLLPSEAFFRHPSFFTPFFLHSHAPFFFCPSSICHLYFAATIFHALSGLHSIQFSLLFITPSIFCLSALLLIYSFHFWHLNNPSSQAWSFIKVGHR